MKSFVHCGKDYWHGVCKARLRMGENSGESNSRAIPGDFRKKRILENRVKFVDTEKPFRHIGDMENATGETGMRYKVVERWGGWKIWDTYTNVIGTVTYPTKEIAERLAKNWETCDDDLVEE